MKSEKVLISADNPEGAKLEELLDTLISEIEEKTERVRGVDHQTARNYVVSNDRIIQKLKDCAAMQREALDYAQRHPLQL